jgi:hypothetical protein
VVPAAYSVLDDVVTWNQERQKKGASFLGELVAAVTRRERHSH